MGGIVDTVSGSLQSLIDAYAQIEAIKMQSRLSRAQASAWGSDMPSSYQNPQAANNSTTTSATIGGMSKGTLIALAGVAGLALFVILKK